MPAFNPYVHTNDSYVQDNDLSVYALNPFICITDRTQEDVDRVKYLTEVILAGTNTEEEWTEFTQDLKGALNYSDLERIEYNLNLLSVLLQIPLVSMERDTIPRIPYFKNLLINVKRIRDSFYRLSTTPLTPNMPLNTYGKINDIERILRDAYSVRMRNSLRYMYCGTELYADGNEIL